MTSDTRFDIDVINKTLSFGYYSIQFGISLLKDYKRVLKVVYLATEGMKIAKSASKDIKNHSSRNTIKQTATSVGGYLGGSAGFSAGAAIGTAIFPVVGTMFGGIIGGICGSITGSKATEVVSEVILETVNYDIDDVKCEKCGKSFELRRYQEGSTQKFCHNCRC